MLYVSHYYVGSICRKHYGGLETGEVMVIPCDIPLPGKHVGIQAFYINTYLILCEVEIYGVDIPEGMFNDYLLVHFLTYMRAYF